MAVTIDATVPHLEEQVETNLDGKLVVILQVTGLQNRPQRIGLNAESVWLLSCNYGP